MIIAHLPQELEAHFRSLARTLLDVRGVWDDERRARFDAEHATAIESAYREFLAVFARTAATLEAAHRECP